MENPDNEDIIIPVCILLIAAGIRFWFEVRRLQHHQQIKAHGQHMVNTSILKKFLRPLVS
jgi:hypothetical protein